MQAHVIRAVYWRQLAAYFASPTGYVFITIFVFLSSLAAFWTPAFFDRNLANLDQLVAWFPALLLFLAPAIAMGAWAEEKRDGTDELLLSLPATSWELVIGKHAACVAIYTVALAFAAAGQGAVLLYLGKPDAGLLMGVYLGEWLAGSALLAVAMAAGALTSNLTVSFILGAAACGVFVGAGALASLAPDGPIGHAAKALALSDRFADFGRGVVTLSGVAYFLGVGAVGLWANVFLIERSHWVGGPGSGVRSGLGVVRAAAFMVAALAIVSIFGRVPVRADVTAERLWSLSKETRALLGAIPDGRVAMLTAYVSPANETPGAFTQTRENLLGALREIAAVGGDKVRLRVVETSPFTDAAREAEKNFGIRPRTIPPMPDDPSPTARQLFLGVAATGGAEQSVIPFMNRGLPPEYEVARALRAVTAASKKKVGILETEAGVFGRFNFQTFTPARDWPIVDELRRQYEVVKVARRQPIPADLDALIVAQPSTLTDAELPPVLDYLRAGRPALIVEDPLPLVNPALATTEARDAGRNPFQQQQQPQEPKANLAPLWSLLGVTMDGTKVVWDAYNPRPQLAELPREFVFVGRGLSAGGGAQAKAGASFNDEDGVTSGLQEVVLLAPGGVRPAQGSTLAFTPLLSTSPVSGTVNYADVLTRSIFGFGGFNPARKFVRTPKRPILAARVTGTPASPAPAPEAKDGETPAPPKALNVIVLADLDAMSEEIFRLREEGYQDMQFDNVTFVLNAVDSLAGDESLVDLRKRRRVHRTLARLEDQRLSEQRETQSAIDEANRSADEELAQARARLDAKVKEIEQRQDLDETQRRIMVESVRQAEQRRLDVQSGAIEDAKQARIEDARADARRQIDRIEMRIRTAAVALPPIPALALACVVFARRRSREREGVGADRLR